jgi:predicted HTH transcriptional regulator
LDRVDLVENNEYGYCSLVKATKQVLDKIKLENKTLAKITSKERIEKRLWNSVALREAMINAIVHNDYTSEVPPKFEFFDDRIEITSFGSLPQGMTEKEFFEGYSVPRNKELMRVFRDLDLVEHLGSGVPRILRSYGKECFKFTENFLRMIFQATEQVKELVKALEKEMNRQEIQDRLGLAHRENFRTNYLKPALEQGFVEMTIPEKPNSSLQKYRLTILGKQLRNKL